MPKRGTHAARLSPDDMSLIISLAERFLIENEHGPKAIPAFEASLSNRPDLLEFCRREVLPSWRDALKNIQSNEKIGRVGLSAEGTAVIYRLIVCDGNIEPLLLAGGSPDGFAA